MRLQFGKSEKPALWKHLTRRKLLKSTGLAAVAGITGCGTCNETAKQVQPKIRIPIPTIESIGVKPAINCWGTITVLSGSLMPVEVKMAMEEMSKKYVFIVELMEGVGKRMSELSGAEWGIITNSAAASIYLSTAACVTGDDPEKINKLPDTGNMKNEVIMPEGHAYGYQVAACSMTGQKLIQVKTPEEMEAAVSDKTSSIQAIGDRTDKADPILLEDIVRIAKKHGVPTFIDAAAERPDYPNPYIQKGIDLVCYSGGKCLRGPQSAGVLLGRKDLCKAAFRNSSPHGGIGRTMKVGKEEIMGALTALDLWVNGRDHETEYREFERKLNYIKDSLSGISGVTAEVVQPSMLSNVAPRLEIAWEQNAVKISPSDAHDQLLNGEPRIKMSTMGNGLSIMSYMMEEGDEIPVGRRLKEVLSGAV
ncbi:aminotransferase class V-fold PLP-dependent enzyme [Candidatus Latescibacterota bacterium]